MLETFNQIADLVKTLPHGSYPRVDLGTNSEEAVKALVAAGGTPRTYLYPAQGEKKESYAIDGVDLNRGGVVFSASFTRAPTVAEQHRIATEARQVAPACFAV